MTRQTHFLKVIIGVLAAIFALTLPAGSARAAVDIGPMTWTPRSDWVNVKNCSALTGDPNAVGDGVTDDTAALQGVLTYVQNTLATSGSAARCPVTVYFPPGTYLLKNTLAFGGTQTRQTYGISLIGCGSNTVIRWGGAAGPAMLAPDGTDNMRYLGFVWDGNNLAGCGIELNTTGKFTPYPNDPRGATYETDIRIENCSFRNFTHVGTYAPPSPNNGLYGAGIAQGFNNSLDPTSEVMVYNCCFSHCTIGAATTLEGAGNNYMWNVDGCEFENCGWGITSWAAACYVVTNCHFQQSQNQDIYAGQRTRIRHCTSQGSQTFYTEGQGSLASTNVLEDCWVDGWTNGGPAVFFGNAGPNTVFDCTFTHPPANSKGAIHNNPYNQNFTWPSFLLSNNSVPASPAGFSLMDAGPPSNNDVIPPGRRGGLVSSPTQAFLKTAWPADSTNIIDVTQAPYTADPTGSADATAPIQAAINAAQSAHSGAVVYFPVGQYKISSTLTASGGSYTLQGTGVRSGLVWAGAGGGTLLAISNPRNVTVQGFSLDSGLNNVTGTAILETATGPSSITYDEIYCPLKYDNGQYPLPGQGLVLSGLPAGSTVYVKHVKTPFKVVNCGAAHILAKYLEFSTIAVSGATRQTGFLGVMEGEDGVNLASPYNVTIGDNQDFVMDDYYSEIPANELDMERGVGTGTGRVTLQGLASAPSKPATTIQVNNYAGRLFYSGETVSSGSNGPVQITATGSNPLDLILGGNTFAIPTAYAPFAIGSSPGLNPIEAVNNQFAANEGEAFLADRPNPLSSASLASISAGLDHLRQLDTAEAAQQAGLVGYWKLDESAGPISHDSSISGLDGTWIGGLTFSAAPPTIGLFNPGSLSFNDVNQCVSVPNSAALPSGEAPRTLCGWAKAGNAAGGYRWIASYGSPQADQAMFIGMNGNTLYGGGYADDLIVSFNWADNNWHFIALTYDGTTACLYADGVLKASGAKNWNLIPGNFYIGEQVNNMAEYWNGSVDDVRIYNRALSAADVSSLAGR